MNLADELFAYAQYLATEGFDSGDVRLQVFEGKETLHTGDACYDVDHRGTWSCGTVLPDMTHEDCVALATQLQNENE